MAATTFNIPSAGEIWFAGDTLVFEFPPIEVDGVPLNLTGYDIKFTAKQAADDADNALTTIQKTLGSGLTVPTPSNGIVVLTLQPIDTDQLEKTTTYVWDLQLNLSGTITTVAYGNMTITMDVTQG